MTAQDYAYDSAERAWADSYIAPRLLHELRTARQTRRVLDAGCGNGNLTARLAASGFEMVGFDTSESGVAQARGAHPGIRFELASAYEDLRERFGGGFDACISVEVVEHLYSPQAFVQRIFDVLRPGGLFILSTPYHGYVKNVVLALTGRTDAHYTALWEGGHIKFWSRTTLTQLLRRGGFEVVGFQGAGRAPWLWKSMIVTARKP
jgi:2-polyprenyl-3-methyl-5-hydroxy-6-metoxy-1,4-benzoquinol methylase